MVKNEKGGNKTKKLKRGYQKKAILDNTEVGQMFGQIVENRGDHWAVLCTDNVTRMGKLSSAAKRGQRLLAGSFVVLSIREYETSQKNCDIIAAGNPPSDIRNIFRKINPIAGEEGNIEFYTEDKFKEFKELEELQSTKTEQSNIRSLSEMPIDKDTKVDDVFDDVFDDGDEIYKDPKVLAEQIDWDDL